MFNFLIIESQDIGQHRGAVLAEQGRRDVMFDGGPRKADRVAHGWYFAAKGMVEIETQAARHDLGYEPRVSIAEGLERLAASFFDEAPQAATQRI